MKLKRMTAFMVLMAFIVGLAACGQGNGVTEEDTVAESTRIEITTEDSEEAVQNEASVLIPEPEAGTGAEKLLGEWQCIDEEGRFATITKNEEEFIYEDNEGKYSAVFRENVLTVKVSDTETADVFIDGNTGSLILKYQGSMWEYTKKG